MSTFTFFDYWDALVTQCQALSGFCAPSAVQQGLIPVYDSLLVGLYEDHPNGFLVIGWSGDPAEPEDTGEAAQVSATVSVNRTRDDAGSIRCMAVGQSGDRNDAAPRAAREQARTIMAAVENLVRTNPTLGLAGRLRLIQFGDVTVSMSLTDRGVACSLGFTLNYRSRLE